MLSPSGGVGDYGVVECVLSPQTAKCRRVPLSPCFLQSLRVSSITRQDSFMPGQNGWVLKGKGLEVDHDGPPACDAHRAKIRWGQPKGACGRLGAGKVHHLLHRFGIAPRIHFRAKGLRGDQLQRLRQAPRQQRGIDPRPQDQGPGDGHSPSSFTSHIYPHHPCVQPDQSHRGPKQLVPRQQQACRQQPQKRDARQGYA